MQKDLHEEKFLHLKKIFINTQDSFGKTQEFNTWNSANRFLRQYNIKPWEHENERIHYSVEWDDNYTVSSSFILPSEEDALTENFLQSVIQDFIQDKLLLPDSILSKERLDKLVGSTSFLSSYTGYTALGANSFHYILGHAEGMDFKKYHYNKERLDSSLERLYKVHPLITKIIDEAHKFYERISSLEHRTRYFKEFVFREGNKDISKAISHTLSLNKTDAVTSLDKLRGLVSRVCEDISILDERYTEQGMKIYQLYPLDVQELPQLSMPLNDFQAKDMRDRILHVKTAGVADATQPEHSIFYSCYLQCQNEIVQLPFEQRSHRKISCLVFYRLRLYNISKSRRAVLIDLYDPFAVGFTGYGKEISKFCESSALAM